MTRPQPIHARPDGPFFVFDPTTGEWVERDPAAAITSIDGGEL
jgi:hypothetical protein